MKKVFLRKGSLDLSFIEAKAGEWVVVKPNLVKEHKENDPREWQSVITSSQLIRQVVEHVCAMVGPGGRITICDAPQTDSSFKKIAAILQLERLASECRERFGTTVETFDLRNEEWTNEGGVIVRREKLAGDPNGVIRFNLGRASLFYGFGGEGRYYGADYDAGEVNRHHRGEVQEYLLCGTPIKADVYINLPKLKTHKKTGVSLSLKNLVGINADKNWLPHHTEGSPADGGDEFPELDLLREAERRSVKFAKMMALKFPGAGPALAKRLRKAGTTVFGDGTAVIRSGNWHGNDTTWRMVLDLNRCLLYGRADGSLNSRARKRYYSVVDGIIGMEGMGPMQGDPVRSGVVLGGDDPVAVDMVAARVMGFDWRKIATIREAFSPHEMPIANCLPSDVYVESDVPQWNGRFLDIENQQFLSFEPHFGWKGHIEYRGKRA